MPVDPQIPLAVRTPEAPNVLGTIGQLMQLRNSAAEIQQRQALAEQERQNAATLQAQAEQRNRDLADQNTEQALSKDPETAKAIASGDLSSMQGKVQPIYVAKRKQEIADVHAKLATTHSTELKNYQDSHAALAESINGLKLLAEKQGVSTMLAQVPGTFSELQKAGVISSGTPLPTITSVDDLDKMAAQNSTLQGAVEGAQKLKKEQQAILTSAAQQTEAEASARQKTADAALKDLELNLRKNFNPATIEQGVEDLFPKDPQFAQAKSAATVAGKLAIAGSGKPEDATTAIRKIYDEQVVPQLQQKALLPGEVAKSVAVEKAVAPIKAANEVAVRTAVANAMGDSSPELAKVPLNERKAVRDRYEKSLLDLNATAADANRLHALVQASQSGNQVTPTLAQLAELRTIVNRVTGTEFGATQGAGSTIERLQGWINGKVEGQPIPKEIMKDMDTTSGLLMDLADQKHAGEVKAINLAQNATLPAKTAADLGYRKSGTLVPTPKSQAEYDALPKDAQFMKPGDTKVYIKK